MGRTLSRAVSISFPVLFCFFVCVFLFFLISDIYKELLSEGFLF